MRVEAPSLRIEQSRLEWNNLKNDFIAQTDDIDRYYELMKIHDTETYNRVIKTDAPNYKQLEDYKIAKEGQSDYVDAKYQEIEDFISNNLDDAYVPTKVIEDGDVLMKEVSLKEELVIITKEQNTINKLMDCAV